MEDAPETLLAAWLSAYTKEVQASLHVDIATQLAAMAIRRRRWSMVEPTYMAGRALLLLWDQQDSVDRLLPSASQFIAARPGLYAGGHEILLETLIWADKLHTGNTISDEQLATLHSLLVQGLHIGSGTGEAMHAIRTQVNDSLDILIALGRGPALHDALAKLKCIGLRVLAAATTLASLSRTSMVLKPSCQAALSDLRLVKLQIEQAVNAPALAESLQTWPIIHQKLNDRLLELGIHCTPRQLNELQLRGSPSKLVQVLFASGRLDPGHFA